MDKYGVFVQRRQEMGGTITITGSPSDRALISTSRTQWYGCDLLTLPRTCTKPLRHFFGLARTASTSAQRSAATASMTCISGFPLNPYAWPELCRCTRTGRMPRTICLHVFDDRNFRWPKSPSLNRAQDSWPLAFLAVACGSGRQQLKRLASGRDDVPESGGSTSMGHSE